MIKEGTQPSMLTRAGEGAGRDACPGLCPLLSVLGDIGTLVGSPESIEYIANNQGLLKTNDIYVFLMLS